MSNDAKLAAIEKTLTERRANLLDHLGAVEAALTESHDPDLGEQAVEREADEVLEQLGRADRHELAILDAALARIAEGSYGICTRCGDDIADKRLEALPETPFCQSCASDL